MPVFDGGNYPASCTSVGETTLLFISKQDFHAACLAHPQVSLKVLRTVGARLRHLVGIIEELSFTTVRERLIALLVRQAEATGRRSKEGLQFELTKSHQELAAELGTVRELVSRNLSRLQAEGLLEVEGRKIVVKDLAGLKQERAGPTTPRPLLNQGGEWRPGRTTPWPRLNQGGESRPGPTTPGPALTKEGNRGRDEPPRPRLNQGEGESRAETTTPGTSLTKEGNSGRDEPPLVPP